MQRPLCSVFIATSVDGYIARADGTFDFLSIVDDPEHDYGFSEFFASVDAHPGEKWSAIIALLVMAFFCLRYLRTGRVF